MFFLGNEYLLTNTNIESYIQLHPNNQRPNKTEWDYKLIISWAWFCPLFQTRPKDVNGNGLKCRKQDLKMLKDVKRRYG